MKVIDWPQHGLETAGGLAPQGDELWYTWQVPMRRLGEVLGGVGRVLEIGMGYGTKILLDMPRLKRLDSVEMNRDWIAKCAEEIGDMRATAHHALYGEPEWLREKAIPLGPWDMALVDGISGGRAACANWIVFRKHAPLVFLHDFAEKDEWWHFWGQVMVPEGWTLFRYQDQNPTGILAHGDLAETVRSTFTQGEVETLR